MKMFICECPLDSLVDGQIKYANLRNHYMDYDRHLGNSLLSSHLDSMSMVVPILMLIIHYSLIETVMALLVYVDDFILTTNDSTTCNTFKAFLNDCFSIKDLGLLKYFFGIDVAHGPHGLFLSQRKYALK